MDKFKLSEKRKKWLGTRDVNMKGTRLNYNASLQTRYKRALNKLTREMLSDVTRRVRNLFKIKVSRDFFKAQKEAEAMDESITSKATKLMKDLQDKFYQLFNKNADPLAKAMIQQTEKSSAVSLKTSLKKLSGGLSLNTSVVPSGMEDVSKALVQENVNLIKSIPEEYLKKIEGAIMRSITSGNGLADLGPELKKYSGQTDRRVSLLALDQTRKAYNSINKQRMQAVGVKQFEWVHSGGSREPRKSHMEISGNIYDFDDLPLKGQEGFVNGQFPGQAINCRCTMIPVIEFEDGERV